MPRYVVTIRDGGSYLGAAEVFVEAPTPERAEERGVEAFNRSGEPESPADVADVLGVELSSLGFADGAVFSGDRPRSAA